MSGLKGKGSQWVGGLAEWTIGSTAYLSVVFSWRLREARARAVWYRALGYDVVVGGPALYDRLCPDTLSDVATVRPSFPDAIRHQNPDATFATRGCNERCSFCNVWRIDGDFTYFPEFPVRPLLCDNNLSAIDPKYQQHIVERYRAESVPLLDANSGFEPKTFDREVFDRWASINRGPWRFGYDETKERNTVQQVMTMLREAGLPPKRIRPYVLIGCEPFEECMGRIRDVIQWGGEPHVQPFIKPTAMEREPHVSRAMGWTRQLLTDVARWANRRIWRYAPFLDYQRSAKSSRMRYDTQQGLFL